MVQKRRSISAGIRGPRRGVSLQIGADEIQSPPLTGAVAGGQNAVGKAATHSQRTKIGGPDLKTVDLTHFEIGDASGKGLA